MYFCSHKNIGLVKDPKMIALYNRYFSRKKKTERRNGNSSAFIIGDQASAII